MKSIRKSMAVFVLVSFVFLPLLSGCYIKQNTNHNCTKKDCPICLELKEAEHLLHSFKYVLPGAAIAIIFIGCFISLRNRILPFIRVHTTLITLRVEIWD